MLRDTRNWSTVKDISFIEILVRMCKFRMRYNTLQRENTAGVKNNIDYLENVIGKEKGEE